MVVTCWSAWYLSYYSLPQDVTGINQKVFLRAFHSHWDCENCQIIDGDMAKWSLWHKKNLIEFLLDFLYYLYNYYIVCAVLSHTYHMTCYVTLCDMIHVMWLWLMTLSHTPSCIVSVTNFIQPYLHQFFNNSYSLNGYGKPSKRPFDWCQSCLETINIGWDIRQIN